MARCWRGASAQALGVGLRGRAALAGGAARRGCVPDGAPWLRVPRSGGAGPAVGRVATGAPVGSARVAARGDLRGERLRARAALLRPLVQRRGARVPRAVRSPARRRRAPEERSRGEASRRSSRGARRSNGGDPVRRRHERRRRRRAARRRRWRGTRRRSISGRWTGCSRSTGVARRAHPGGRLRAATSRSSSRARPHAAPLPAELRALDPRRLDRDPRRRPLRDALHAHRRSRRVGAHGHAARGARERGDCRRRGAGPAPERLVLGSEGTLGVVTEAWMRVRPRPGCARRRACGSPGSWRGARRARGLRRAGLYPSNCRLLDPREAMLNGVPADGARCSSWPSSRPTTSSAWMTTALAICARARRHVGGREGEGRRARRGRERGGWRQAFVRAPYLQSARAPRRRRRHVRDGVHVGPLRGPARARARGRGGGDARRRAAAGPHVPFHPRLPGRARAVLHVRRPGRPGEELAQWEVIKSAAGDALAASGGTITHHHAVGRLHRPWYERQVPELFVAALGGRSGRWIRRA